MEPCRRTRLLLSANASQKAFNIATNVSRGTLSELDPDEARYFDSAQFMLDPGAHGACYLVPNTGAKNKTMVNGVECTQRTALETGDEISAENRAKGVKKLPMMFSIGATDEAALD